MKQLTATTTESQDPLLDNVTLLLGYALRAIRRRWLLAFSTFAVTLLLTLVFLWIAAPVYKVETRVLVNDDDVMSTLTSSKPKLPAYGPQKVPTADAVELVKSRGTLTALIEQLKLDESWQETRTPFGKFVDRAFASVFGRPSKEEQFESLVRILNERISAEATDNTLTFAVEWHEPETAIQLARALQDRFLSERRDTELNQIKESFSILEENVHRADQELARATALLRDAAENVNRLSSRLFKLRRNQGAPDLETVARLEREVAKKREQVQRLEAAYDARRTGAEATMNALRATLGPNHPDVLAARRAYEEQSRPPAGLIELQAEESRLGAELNHLAPQVTAAQLLENMAAATNVDPDVEAALGQYRRKAEDHAQLIARLNEARTELDTATAAFAYHYVVTQPPVMPRHPDRPNVPQVFLAGMFGGLVLACLLAVLADLLSRRIQEPWQVARFLQLPVLGEVSRSRV